MTPLQFEVMRRRLGGGQRSPGPVLASTSASGPARHQVILGIDPSLRGTGFGILRLARPVPQVLDQGVVHCPSGWPRSRCLAQTAQALRQTLQQHHPTVCAVEGLFYAQNLQTALIMGEARGVCLLVAAEAGLEIFEIAARKVKQAIVGYGAAQKSAVAKMVQRLLHLAETPKADAADALALALAFAQESRGLVSLVLKSI